MIICFLLCKKQILGLVTFLLKYFFIAQISAIEISHKIKCFVYFWNKLYLQKSFRLRYFSTWSKQINDNGYGRN